MKDVKPFSIFGINFWKCYFVQMRPYLLFVSGIAGIMGATLYNSELNYVRFILSAIAFFLGYGFGQALTDTFQMDTDQISSPYRPLSRGVISKKQVLFVSLFGLLIIALIIIYLSWQAIFLCVLSIIGLATYSFVKHYWFTGPFHNSWIVMLLPAMGFLSMGGSFNFDAIKINELLPYLITFFSYCNFVLIGYLKDIEADRKTGYNTFPVVFGWNRTLWAGNINILIYLTCGYFLVDQHSMLSKVFFALSAIVAIYGQIAGFNAKDNTPSSATVPIANTVRAFILIHIMIILENKPHLLVFSIIYYFIFEIFLYYRPEKTQI